jgi:3-methyladenine DNA glycosylase AlkD
MKTTTLPRWRVFFFYNISMKSADTKKALKKLSSKKRAESNAWFFKTGKGEYGEGDKFIGVTMPNIRKVVKEFKNLSLSEIEKLLKSKIHEERMCGLLILVEQFNESPKEIYKFYLKNIKGINNWDLVDVTAHKIIGKYLLDTSYLVGSYPLSRGGETEKENNREILYELASSKNLWEQRISIISTFAFIDQKDFKDTLKISKVLLNHEHDLIHKAVGWVLREVGKKDEKVLKDFLKKHYKKMPRTMLRYAIEKFPETERQRYLKNTI